MTHAQKTSMPSLVLSNQFSVPLTGVWWTRPSWGKCRPESRRSSEVLARYRDFFLYFYHKEQKIGMQKSNS